MQGVGRKMAKGAAWMVGFKLIERSIGLISTIILAKLLLPEDFGLIAMATSVIAVAELLQAFNFDVALIQNQDSTRADYDSAWTLNILLAAGCAALLAATAYPMAVFYGDPRVEYVIYCLALGMLIQGFENIGIIAFRKELTFHKDFWFLLAKKLAAFVIVVSCAYWLRNYWALVIGMVASRLIGVGLSYTVHPYRPRCSLAKASALVHFSKWLLITNALAVARLRGADVIVGRLAGANALGLFTISYEISNLPTSELSAPINRAVFPGYAALSADSDALKEGTRKVMAIILLLTMPAALGIALVADPMVRVFLGTKWMGAVPLIQVLAFFGMISSFQSNLGFIFIAKGRTRFVTMWSIALIGLQIPLVIIGVQLAGTLGAAFGLLASVVIPLPFVMVAVSRMLGFTLLDWTSMLWRPLISSAAMGVASAIWAPLMLSGIGLGDAQVLLLLFSVLLGAFTYGACIVTLWVMAGRPPGPEEYLFERAVALTTSGRGKNHGDV
jgi:O-antigen/teichoic acid export membrane protein